MNDLKRKTMEASIKTQVADLQTDLSNHTNFKKNKEYVNMNFVMIGGNDNGNI